MTALAELPNIPASDVKKRGWRGVMRALAAKGPVVVTNHSEPEAVIVSAQDYVRLLSLVAANAEKTEAGLETLRRRFDERLAALQRPDTGDQLRAVAASATKLRGKVKAGAVY